MADMQDQPSATAMIIGTALVAGVSGYMIGLASSLGLIPNPFVAKPPRQRGIANYDDEEESTDEEIDDSIKIDHAPNWANGIEADRRDGLRAVPSAASKKPEVKKPEAKKAVQEKQSPWDDSTEECKMVLVVRTDLGMRQGKIAAQCAHAALACYKTFLRDSPKSPILRRWERQGQAKIALQVKTEEQLEVLQARAISMGLVAEVIVDAGRTQIEAGSQTVLGIGPAPKSVIDEVTGGLKLL